MDQNLKDVIRALGKKAGSLSMIENAKVISVDKSENTCMVTLLDTELELEVKIKSITGAADDLGFVIYPKKGSIVSICMIDDDSDNLRLLDCTEIESATLKVGSAIKLKLNSTGIVELSFTQLILGAGGFGGLPKIGPLVKAINGIEQKVNDAIDVVKTHVHGSAGTPPTPTPTIKALDKTNQKDLENTDVKH